MTDDPEREPAVRVHADRASDWTLDPNIFGRFSEHLGSVMYPGVFEDYLKNGSFEVWHESGSARNSGIVFPEVSAYEDVAYPWEPVENAGEVALDQRAGGVHGRAEAPALEAGVGVPESFELEPAGVTEPRYQRITLAESASGGVGQRVALPDFRTDGFDVTLSVRGEGVEECTVALTPVSDGEDSLGRATVPVTDEWERHEVRVDLDEQSPDRYRDSRYGAYRLTVTASGDGHLDLDWATLIPEDAVEGKFNPTTIDLLQEYDVTNVRWPGGNYASQYRWRDGVGPIDERPVKPIVNWSGLEPNYLGTNEFLRFCELADVEPYLTVPFWEGTGPEEAAAWVEYCNGDPEETELGALRAEHGHPEPWDVKWWGVGNEVWGWFQVGGTDAASYAEEYEAYHEAMRAVDPDVELDASAIGLGDTKYHDGSRDEDEYNRPGELPVWNDILLEQAGETIEGFDVHHYVWGIGRVPDEEAKRAAWLEENDEDPVGYNEVLVNYPEVWERLLVDLRETAAEHGVDDLRVTAGEWALSPAVDDDWPEAKLGTMAYAAFAARMFQAFVRQGDAVQLGHWTEFTLFPYPDPNENLPPNPGAHVQKALADPILESDADWYRVETTVRDSPTRQFPQTGLWTPAADDVSLVDAVTVGTDAASGRELLTLVVNGSLDDPVETSVTFGPDLAETSVEVTTFEGADGDPFAVHRNWDERDGFTVTDSERVLDDDGTVPLSLPPGSVALVSLSVE